MATTCMVTPGKNKDIRVTESRKLLWELGKVIDIKSISPKVKLFTIETKKPHRIEPGQHFDIKLTSDSGYVAQRSYSVISDSNYTNQFQFGISKITDGEVSKYLHEKLSISQNLLIRGPIGKYFNLNKTTESVILIAGGIGITPFIFYLRQKNYKNKISLIYSAKNQEEFLFKKELENKNKLYENFSLIVTLTKENKQTWKGLDSRINSKILKKTIKNHLGIKTTYFVCGGSNFVENISSKLIKIGIEYQDIKIERFGP